MPAKRQSFWMHFGALGGFIETLLEPHTKYRRALKEARLLLREARRMLRRFAHRLSLASGDAVRAAVDTLAAAVDTRDYEKLPDALNGLDKALDEHLAFARKSTIREYAESIGVAILIALFLRAFVVEAFKIPSGSMIPTLQVGDHIFVNKFIYGVRVPGTNIKLGMGYRKPKRGEVIVFIYPLNPDQDFIKRIVGLPGDTVEMRKQQVYVNGVPIPRRHLEGSCQYRDYLEEAGQWETKICDAWQETVNGSSYTTFYDVNSQGEQFGPRTVPPDRLFVMGDNRDNSSDSRRWGFVPFENIRGKAMVIWLSLGEANDDFFLTRFFKSIRIEREGRLVK
jgi:signal peptidase I